jgi:arginase
MQELSRDMPGQKKKVGILGIPLGFGAGEPGSESGVAAMRTAVFRGHRLAHHLDDLGFDVRDHGNAAIDAPSYVAESTSNPKYLPEMIKSCVGIMESVTKILEDDSFPILLGGDHSIAVGTFSALNRYFRGQESELGLIWFDAHADMNTPETSPSGNLHGMPLATLMGVGHPSLTGLAGSSPALNMAYLAHVGGRDLDFGEKKLIHELGLRDHFFTMSDIDRRGMTACVNDAVAIASRAPGGYAVTFDVDIIDPHFAPGSGTLVRGGITYREAHLALEIIAQAGGMQSFEIVEVNPALDSDNLTVELSCELILSALGKTVL